jgi:outer membrane protein assembly factor BamA
MKLSEGMLVVFLFSIGSAAYAQDEEAAIDSLSTNVLQSVFKEDPDHISNEESDSTKRFTLNAYPYVFYTPETKLAFGAGGILLFYTKKSRLFHEEENMEKLKPSKIGFGGYYSTNNQYKITIDPKLYFFHNKIYFELPTSYGFFVNKYWGIGDDTPNRDSVSYSQQSFTTSFAVQVPPLLFMADRTGLILAYQNIEIVDKMGNELLLNDSLPGSNGATQIGLGTDLVWDSRDNIFFPNSGLYQYVKLMFYPGVSEYVYSSLELDAKGFWSFAPDHVFALNMYVQTMVGDTPFYNLPSVGGPKRMRGYFYGRYRDNFYGMMQAEYRQYFWKRLGFVVFGGAGNVSHNILEYNFSDLKYSYGAGLRFLFNEKERVNLRMDIGFGNDGNRGIYFGIQEAF